LLPRRIERMSRLIKLRLGRDTGHEEARLTIVLLPRVRLGISGGAKLHLPLPIGRLERLNLQPRVS